MRISNSKLIKEFRKFTNANTNKKLWKHIKDMLFFNICEKNYE